MAKEILRKCQKCDKSGERSIDIENDDFLIVKKNGATTYYHTDCYLMHLITRKKDRKTEEEALIEIENIKTSMKEEVNEKISKEKFISLLMDYYGITFVPKRFYLKLSSIKNGTYQGIQHAIMYSELLEMYQNPKQISNLERLAGKKGIQRKDRLDWDLAIVLSNYDKYKKWKLRQTSVETVEDKKIKSILTKMKEDTIKKNNSDDDSVDINELIL